MDLAVQFAALVHSGLNIFDFHFYFVKLAERTAFDDETSKSMFWIGANYYHPVDLPDTKGLSWREVIIRYVESIYPRSRQWPDPEPSPPPPLTMENSPKSPTDGELLATARNVPSMIALTLKQTPQSKSDQGCEPATTMTENPGGTGHGGLANRLVF